MKKELSYDYHRRRSQLIRARAALGVYIAAALAGLAGICLLEAWWVRWLIASRLDWGKGSFALVSIFVLVVVYCIGTARVTLHIVYHLDRAGLARNAVLFAFSLAYVFVLYKLPSPQTILPLAAGKQFAIFLFFSFWQSQVFQARVSLRSSAANVVFDLGWKSFWVCKWVLCACFLLNCLGLALAIVSVHPVIEMEGWEGVMLMGTFFFLFYIFVRNPVSNAHSHKR